MTPATERGSASASTGNAVRGGVKEPPRCGTRGLFIEAGAIEGPDAEEGGIVVEELMGTHTANGVTGRFLRRGHGQPQGQGQGWAPFKGVILSGNLFDLLNQVKAVGKRLYVLRPIRLPDALHRRTQDKREIGGERRLDRRQTRELRHHPYPSGGPCPSPLRRG